MNVTAIDVNLAAESARSFQQQRLQTQLPGAALSEPSPDDAPEAATDETTGDPELQLARRMVEYLAGAQINWFEESQSALQSNTQRPEDATPTTLLTYEKTTEIQAYQFDYELAYFDDAGNTVSVQGSLAWRSERVTEQLRIEQRLQDPLVLSFDGGPVRFNGSTAFDLDSDGRADALPTPAGKAGYVARDLNNNGKIDANAELIGLTSGDAWAELRALDDNQDGWLSSEDTAFDSLYWWQPGASQALSRFADQHIDAVYLNAVATPATLYQDNQPLAQLRSSGVFIHHGQHAGVAQQFDFYV